jgi:hypothetical protein
MIEVVMAALCEARRPAGRALPKRLSLPCPAQQQQQQHAAAGRHQLHAEAPWLERCVGTLNQPERKARRGGRRCPPVHSATAATCSRRQPPHRRGVARIARRWLQLNESAAAYESVPVKKLLLLLSKLCGETLVRDTAPSSPRPPLRHLWR